MIIKNNEEKDEELIKLVVIWSLVKKTPKKKQILLNYKHKDNTDNIKLTSTQITRWKLK